MRIADGVVRRLVGDKLTVEYADGRTTERVVPGTELPEVLASLDVVLSDEEVDRLRLLKARRPGRWGTKVSLGAHLFPHRSPVPACRHRGGGRP